ncbi:Sensor histidine kinase YesM [Paenibacillus sp. UNCCL117]|uniref:sensor histidine kinase n=1 Tax=unclassified Paenibacillus TaxID=185978 RepID=UPI00087F3C4F|nr:MULTISPECIES: histidine kinase [unclassified Paenibacillus]SDC27190.1 Sensor histidine kinase YesM [Paenibacillus sp. cl123]SFW20282.1 Sensor histidine kinase YesM [Paenibacillus sp. UNCCL117]
MIRIKRNHFKFFHIILAFNILTVLICSVTISFIIYGRLNQTLNMQNEEFMHYATSQALNGLESIIKNSELTARSIYSDSTVTNLFLGKRSGGVDYVLFNQFMNINNIFENYITTNQDIKSISIYKMDPELITDGKNIKSIESFQRQDLMKRAIDARGKDVWVTYEEEGEGIKILLLKYLNINLPGGVLAIEMNQERLTDLYKVEEDAKYLFYVLSEGNIVFRSNQKALIGKETLDNVEKNVERDKVYSKIKQGSNFYYSYYGKVNHALNVVILYDAYELEKEKRSIAKYVMMCTCFFVLIGVLLAILFSTRFAHNIEKLVNKMKSIEKGNLKISPDKSSILEISALDKTLCKMARTIEELTEDIARTERQKVESEFKYLQKQMNPHFLYNLLSAVRWIAFHKNENKIVTIIDLLSDFYRIVLSQGRDIIPIKSEIKLIEKYVALQNLCHSDQIKLNVYVGKEYEDLLISKMTIQPFVENSIIHGRVHGKIINIDVVIHKKGNCVIILIKDNGMGVKDSFIEYIKSLNRGEISDYKVGYGVTNTFMRLKLFYSNASIHVYHGNPGTIVEISFSVENKLELNA